LTEKQFAGVTRIENFSDAVLAIIITIMVLEFRLPEHAVEQGLWTGVIRVLAPKVLSYALSFVLLTSMWIGHHTMMQGMRFATPRFMWANNNLLFWLSIIPLVTSILGDDPFVPLAAAIYGASLAAVTWSFIFLRWLGIQESTFSHEPIQVQSTGLKRAMLAGCFYLASIPLAFVSVYISFALFVAVPGMFFFWHMGITKKILAGAHTVTPAQERA
jgi:uncharacterized membrane protein